MSNHKLPPMPPQNDDERFNMIIVRIDRLEDKLTARLDTLFAFRNMVLGASALISFVMTLLVTYLKG